MLPFLKRKEAASPGLIVQTRTPDKTDEHEEHEEHDEIEECCQEMIDAIHSKDAKQLAKALKDCFQMMELEPHEEYEHEDDMGDME